MARKIKKIWFCVVCMVMLAVGAGSVRAGAFDLFGTLPKTPAKAVSAHPRILFVGNSFTAYSNFMPAVQKLANANRIYPQISSVTCLGRELNHIVYPNKADQYEVLMHNRLMAYLKNEKWDYVVLQALSVESVTNPSLLKKSVRALLPIIENTGAQTVLYMPWPMRSGHEVYDTLAVSTPEEVIDRTQSLFYDLARVYHVAVAPTGIAFMRNLYLHPNINVYADDNHHASQVGAYLSACVMYATLFNRTPVGTNYYPVFPGMTASTSKLVCTSLQELAADVTVRGDVSNTARLKFSCDEMALQKGTSKVLKYQITSKVNGSRIVRWASSNAKVATVNSAGLVTACGVGSTVITAKLNNNTTAVCTVLVTPGGVKMGVGEKAALAFADKIKWNSGDKTVSSIEDGQVRAVKAGTATLTGKDRYGNQVRMTVKVVSPPKAVQVERYKRISVGDKVKLYAQTDLGTAASGYTYSSSNTSVVEVSQNGILYGRSVGKARIYVKAYNGVMSYCDVTVLVPAAKIQFYGVGSSMIMQWRAVQKLQVVYTPSNTTIKKVKWTSSDPKIVSVDADGVLRAFGKGNVRITAQTVDGTDRKASVTIKVQ